MRIYVYSTTRLFSECLATGLACHKTVEHSLGLSDLASVEVQLSERNPCVLLIDLSNDAAWDEARHLHGLCKTTLIVGLAVSDSPEELVRCAEVGCAGVIPRDSSIDGTLALLRQAKRGELRCSPAAAGSLMRAVSRVATPPQAEIPDQLTQREGEICVLVCEGKTNKEIARALHCCEGTVKNHVHNILSKLNVPRRSAVPNVLRAAAQQPWPHPTNA